MADQVVFGEETQYEGTVGSHHTVLHLLACLAQGWREGGREREGGGGVRVTAGG